MIPCNGFHRIGPHIVVHSATQTLRVISLRVGDTSGKQSFRCGAFRSVHVVTPKPAYLTDKIIVIVIINLSEGFGRDINITVIPGFSHRITTAAELGVYDLFADILDVLGQVPCTANRLNPS